MNYYKNRFQYPLEGRRACGVYAICCDEADVYVGSTVDINWRLKGHVGDLRYGRAGSQKLQALWDERQGQGFSFRVIEVCPRDKLREREAFWQHEIPGLLNEWLIGDKRSSEFCAKMSRVQKELTKNPEVIRQRSERAKRQMQDPEFKAMVIASRQTDAVRARISAGLRKRFEDPEVRKAQGEKKRAYLARVVVPRVNGRFVSKTEAP